MLLKATLYLSIPACVCVAPMLLPTRLCSSKMSSSLFSSLFDMPATVGGGAPYPLQPKKGAILLAEYKAPSLEVGLSGSTEELGKKLNSENWQAF